MRTEHSSNFKTLDEEGEEAKPPARTVPRVVLLPPRSAAASSGSSAQKPVHVTHAKPGGQKHVDVTLGEGDGIPLARMGNGFACDSSAADQPAQLIASVDGPHSSDIRSTRAKHIAGLLLTLTVALAALSSGAGVAIAQGRLGTMSLGGDLGQGDPRNGSSQRAGLPWLPD